MNQREFMQLVDPFTHRLFRLAKRLLVSTDEAADARQEVLLKLWQQKDRLHQVQQVEALALTMTKNYCLDQLKAKRSQRSSLDGVDLHDRGASVHSQVEARDSWSKAQAWIDQLPDTQRLIFQCRDIEDMDYADIAALTGMQETAIRVALSRIRKQLREHLTQLDAL